MRHISSGIFYFFTNIYGPYSIDERTMVWEKCVDFASKINGSWILGGDFNITRFTAERNKHSFMSDMHAFNQFINACNLVDIPISNKSFTWSNRRDIPSFAKLDRFFINGDWEDIFPPFIFICSSFSSL